MAQILENLRQIVDYKLGTKKTGWVIGVWQDKGTGSPLEAAAGSLSRQDRYRGRIALSREQDIHKVFQKLVFSFAGILAFKLFLINVFNFRLLLKLHLVVKIALFGIFIVKFFDRMFAYALKI